MSFTLLLDERLILLNADIETGEECIRAAAVLFEKYGYVKKGYGDAVVEREKAYPTGLPGKGINIAIPHTNSLLVNNPAVGVIVPKKPLKFCMMGTEDHVLECELILPLVVKDPKMQINMLKKLMKVINDNELLMKIRDSKDKKKIIEYLSFLEES